MGGTFGRPSGEPLPWLDEGADANADTGATADEPRAQVVALHRRTGAHADATIDPLPLDTVGAVPWWPADRNAVTLPHAVVRVIADTHRHAGHADVLRELTDGAGMRRDHTAVAPGDAAWWEEYRKRLEHAAREAEWKAERDG